MKKVRCGQRMLLWPIANETAEYGLTLSYGRRSRGAAKVLTSHSSLEHQHSPKFASAFKSSKMQHCNRRDTPHTHGRLPDSFVAVAGKPSDCVRQRWQSHIPPRLRLKSQMDLGMVGMVHSYFLSIFWPNPHRKPTAHKK